MEDNKLKLFLVQTDIIWGDIDANLLHISSLINQSKTSVDVIILPEMFTTGFSMDVSRHSEAINGKAFNWMVSMANKTNAAITGSIIVSENSKFYNRLFWINPDGTWFSYDKRHLFSMGKEDQFYERGNKRLIVTYKGWKICPLICYDLRFPVWARNNNAYDLLIYVANWPSSRNHIWNILLRARAIENQCYVAGVNRIGRDLENVHYIGESCIIHPKAHQVASSNAPREAILQATISLDELRQFRMKFPVLKDADDLSSVTFLNP